MSRGYYVPCAPFLYLVPDSGAPPGMDCLPLQRSPGPFHYLIHEQAKSLVALQELQNEVGALLEFRDLVMETFPHLRTKMAAGTSSPSNIPIPLTGSGGGSSSSGSSKWEPGVRVRRKLHHDTLSLTSSSSRQRKVSSQQPKSGEGSGTSSTGSSAVQDSGFGTETSSSKEHSVKNPAPPPSTTAQAAASTAPVLDEAEDELWNLLDVIHRKGTKLREEVEQLQQHFHQTATATASTTTEGMGPRRRSLGDIEEELCGRGRLKKRLMEDTGGGGGGSLQEDEEMRNLRRERDLLLDKVAEMEAETLASRARTSQLQAELGTLVAAKRDLEEQLRAAVNQKSELNSRIHDLHHQFVSSRRQSPAFAPVSRRHSEDSGTKKELTGGRRLGTLDGIVSSPSRLSRTARGISPDPRKVAAILQEFSAVELQRHLLTTSVENQALHQRLEKTVKSQVDLVEQLEKIKDENDDLKFQLEEKSIELEGTRARVRVLERLQQKDLPPLLPPGSTTNPILPVLALPMPEQSQQPHSSSTESAHDHEQEESTKKVVQSPKRRPSKIPLPGTKSYCAPKPPNGKSVLASNRNRGSPSLKGRTDSNSNASLVGRSGGRESSWKNRSDSNSSLSGGGKSRESSVGGRNSSLSVRNNSRDSLTSGNKSRDSLSGGNKSRDSFTMGKARGSDSLIGAKKLNGDSLSSSASKTSSFSSSSKNKESFSSSLSGGRKGLHHQASICSRSGRASAQGDQNSKEVGGDLGVNNEGDQQCDTYPDSLNHLTTQEASDPTEFKPLSNVNAVNDSEQQNSVYGTPDVQAFPWHHSSSSEYFDSINNSGSAIVYQNNSLSSSYQEQYLQREGLAECDSLENGDVGVELHNIMADAKQDGGNFTGKNLWTTLP